MLSLLKQRLCCPEHPPGQHCALGCSLLRTRLPSPAQEDRQLEQVLPPSTEPVSGSKPEITNSPDLLLLHRFKLLTGIAISGLSLTRHSLPGSQSAADLCPSLSRCNG
ncbi:hypothetical protein chiPu_0026401 [Chiloscyllium punctatum]|uniref:Uncharacterized protein n=1 Tax=Chiloscyllium punctatum TaxID=137246 RepID=A0A401TI49_CHIPU|nr:hypothetical protein [Chiloscyllium punctatum]